MLALQDTPGAGDHTAQATPEAASATSKAAGAAPNGAGSSADLTTSIADFDPASLIPTKDTLVDWGIALGIVIAGVAIALLIHRVLFGVLGKIARSTKTALDEGVVKRLRRPFALVFALIGVRLVTPSLDTGDRASGLIEHALAIGIIVAVAWVLARLVSIGEDAVLSQYRVDVDDNLRARQVHTQIRVIRRIVVVVIVIVAGAAVLMTFPRARQLGTSLLASAGIAGIAVGIAARPVLENLLAGLQIALSQPIRLDDVVVIDGEWGRIEEITTTYVVVRIWDERRLIVPFSRVISQPFQNWTRTSAAIMGTAFINADYTVPVAKVRAELERIVKDHPKWDGRTCVLQVTDATDRTVQLRALVSAKNSGNAWDLRCEVREKLIDFLQREHPECLPLTRGELRRDHAERSDPRERDESGADTGVEDPTA